jgi:DNA-binding IclR family transcriptional regulator
VAKVARQGFAVAPQEALMGVNALAAPVFDAAAELAGTITIVGSIQHLPATPPADIIAAVKNAAANVSARLGYLEVASA